MGRGAVVGAGAVVLPGVDIGDNAVVGGGAVVTRDVRANTVVVGNPARVTRADVAGFNDVGV
jgi:acetyltransferase-like isoleucine patch superfamily enzyme